MIKKSKIKRYINLINTIYNWEKYLLDKLSKADRITYITRNKKLVFDVPSSLGRIFKEIFLDEFYDLAKLRNKTDTSSVVFDIGANAGFFTIFITEKINPKEIHCFEPFPNNFNLLVENIKNIQSFNPNIYLNNLAIVGPGIDSIDLFFDEGQSYSPTASILKGIDTTNKEIKAQATNLEKYCSENNIQKIDLLKMDCEGAEYNIFYNLSLTFFSKIESIYMETHDLDTNQNNTNALINFFSQLEYKTEVIPIHDHVAMIWVVR
jgi:FkbM family methyltransferase